MNKLLNIVQNINLVHHLDIIHLHSQKFIHPLLKFTSFPIQTFSFSQRSFLIMILHAFHQKLFGILFFIEFYRLCCALLEVNNVLEVGIEDQEQS